MSLCRRRFLPFGTKQAAAGAAALLLLAQSGCANLQEDATLASSLAAQLGDAPVAACATALKPLLGRPPPGAEVLYLLEVKWEVKKLFSPDGACEGITAELAIATIDKLLPVP